MFRGVGRRLFAVRDRLLGQGANLRRVGQGQPRCLVCQKLVERRGGGMAALGEDGWTCGPRCRRADGP